MSSGLELKNGFGFDIGQIQASYNEEQICMSVVVCGVWKCFDLSRVVTCNLETDEGRIWFTLMNQERCDQTIGIA